MRLWNKPTAAPANSISCGYSCASLHNNRPNSSDCAECGAAHRQVTASVAELIWKRRLPSGNQKIKASSPEKASWKDRMDSLISLPSQFSASSGFNKSKQPSSPATTKVLPPLLGNSSGQGDQPLEIAAGSKPPQRWQCNSMHQDSKPSLSPAVAIPCRGVASFRFLYFSRSHAPASKPLT
jgi:hypothetical protein